MLSSFDDLAAWCAGAKVISTGQAKEIVQRWSGQRDGDRILRKAVQLRGTLRGTVELIAAGRTSIPQASLDAINEVLRSRSGDLEVVRTKQGFETRYCAHLTEPAHLLVPIAESAADLLSTGDLSLVRKCQNPQCILYFYDTTKNHGRRWCSMTACGNRAKVAAHYQRTRRNG